MTLASAPGLGYPLAVVSGALAGLSSVLFGIGGGIVMVPALSLLFNRAARAKARQGLAIVD